MGKKPDELVREIAFLENGVFDMSTNTVRMENIEFMDMKVNRRVVFTPRR